MKAFWFGRAGGGGSRGIPLVMGDVYFSYSNQVDEEVLFLFVFAGNGNSRGSPLSYVSVQSLLGMIVRCRK